MTEIIVCGFGLVGRKVVEELTGGGKDFVVLDKDPGVLKGVEFPNMVGDATQEGPLKEARIDQAKTLIACTDADATNAFIVLAAKSLNPKLNILTVAKKSESIEKLHMAGADQVVSSSIIGGRVIAKHAISPYIAEFVDRITLTKSAEIADVKVGAGSRYARKLLRESKIRETTGVTVIAVKRGEELMPNPKSDIRIEEGDILIVIGSKEQIKKLLESAK